MEKTTGHRLKGQCSCVAHSSVFKDVSSIYPEHHMCKIWIKNSTSKHFSEQIVMLFIV